MQAAHLQDMWDENHEAWDDVAFLIINVAGAEAGLEDLAESTSLPVLQDTTEAEVDESWGAHGKYAYVVDKAGHPSYIHYYGDFSADRDRLLAEIEELRSEP